ncbi:hypothetical protein B0A48_11805 [Cryoendolithus antarcticus]|uniref:Probable beta-glucosidase E n=1 Tax=Cryoendolithus antarcticus TaxID=1507870 RepID=A0A1V8STB6_9PEZI|nr:hypothetical protein B0A48_11805 [Cryoendolithus antarcticus]
MSLKNPQVYELDRSDSPSRGPYDQPYRYSSDSDDGQDTPLSSQRAYQDDASQPLQPGSFSKETAGKQPLAWLDAKRTRTGWTRYLVPSRFLCSLIVLFIVALSLLLGVGGFWAHSKSVPLDGQSPPWYPSPAGGSVKAWSESYEKAAKLVGQMTLVEKVNVTTGIGWSMGMCVGNTGPVERLGFPSLCLQDGPLGLRFADNATAFPAGVTVGATWNKKLMYQRGKAHGFEAKKKGINALLGPSMGPLGRLPAGGRNWEGFGADPVLQGYAAAQTIKGIQDSGVIATAKHYVANEQEHFRQSWEWGTPNAISSNIDDRTMREMYAWPFAESVRAGVASVMCSYNQVNNSYACQNSALLNGILKDELGFQGFVQSDWLAQRSGVASALAGLDMTMPGDGLSWADGKSLWGSELTKAVLNSSVPMDRLNDMTMRIVAAWYQLGQDSATAWPAEKDGGGPNFSSWTDDEEGLLHPGSPDAKQKGVVNKFVQTQNTTEGGDHDTLARQIAAEGIVMVKNEGDVIPLRRDGSGFETSNEKVKIAVFGDGAFPNPAGDNACKDRACNTGTLAMGWGSGAVELPYLSTPVDALHHNFDSGKVEFSGLADNSGKKVAELAKAQDLCIAFISADAGEGFVSWNGVKGDRNDLYAQKGGDKLVKDVAENCGGDTVVVINTVGPVILEKWIDLPSVKAVLITHLPGQEAGNALADVLFGDVNPSGALPYTIAKDEKDYGPTSGIMYLPNGVVPQQDFTEGLYIDYRHFDKQSIAPRYDFGFGLSYTTFKLSSMFLNPQGFSGATPAPRPDALVAPQLSTEIPDATEALWPKGTKKLKKYVYPYIPSLSSIKVGAYPYPVGYATPTPLSPAGGAEGGNPDLYTTALKVQATLTNTGSVPGQAVVQAYLSFPPNVMSPSGKPIDFPVRVLRQWDKIFVGTSNEEKRQPVRLELTRKDCSYWDVEVQNWVVPKGEFKVCLGFSSRDEGHCSTFELVR